MDSMYFMNPLMHRYSKLFIFNSQDLFSCRDDVLEAPPTFLFS
jgi:hypothetical protein